MTVSNEVVEATVRTYLALVAAGDATALAELYTEDGSLEDPVGSAPRVGRTAITEFYSALADLAIETRLIHLRAAAGEVAFHFQVRTTVPQGVSVIEPIDVMRIDEQGRIVSMRAFWSPQDIAFTPAAG